MSHTKNDTKDAEAFVNEEGKAMSTETLWRITQTRPPCENPGGPASPGMIWAEDAAGRQCSIMIDKPANPDVAKSLFDVVRAALEPAGKLISDLRTRAARSEDKAAMVAETLRRERGNLDVIMGRRHSLFGEVLVQREMGSEAVWIQCPVQRDAGMGIRYETMDDLRAAYPALWPVRWEDGALIMREMKR